MVSIDPERNRYRVYELELKMLKTKTLVMRWGRMDQQGTKYELSQNRWRGEKVIEGDLQELEKKYHQKIGSGATTIKW